MIGVLLAMLGHRRSQAVTVLLLAVIAATAATAAPAYLAAAERSVVASAVAAASPAERTVTTNPDMVNNPAAAVGSLAWAPQALPGFDQVSAVETDVTVAVADGPAPARLANRSGFCPHLTIVAGRCPIGSGEIMIGEGTAGATKLRAGDPLVVRASFQDDHGVWHVVGSPVPLTVTGIYRLADPGDPYWGTVRYTASTPTTQPFPDALFAPMATLQAIGPVTARPQIDQILQPHAVTAAGVGRLRAAVTTAKGADTSTMERRNVVSTAVPDLLDRIDHEVGLVHQVVPVAAVPMVLLCWFVMFLTVGYAVTARRRELGLLRLRGMPGGQRWWLAAGEYALPVLVGAPIGYLLGVLGIRLAVPHLLPQPVPVPMDAGPLPWTATAVGGALLAGLLALRGELAAPAADLLRRAARRTRSRWAAAGEAVVLVLAAAATAQLVASGGDLAGIAQLAPGLVILAVGLLLGRLQRPVAGWVGRRAARRGRPATLLAARQVAQGGVRRLVPLTVVAVALLGFGVATDDVAARGREAAASVTLGAPRVLRVRAVPVPKLIAATRAADPSGRWAMAAVRVDGGYPDEPEKIAVDSTRLAAVANWPAGSGVSAATVAARLRPAAPESMVVRGGGLTVDVDASAAGLELTMVLADQDGRPVKVSFGELHSGRHSYPVAVPCADGCRLAEIAAGPPTIRRAADQEATEPDAFVPTTTLTITDLRTGDPATGSGGQPVAGFDDPRRWRIRPGLDVRQASRQTPDAAPGGLRATLESSGRGDQLILAATDLPYPLPVLTTRRLPDRGLGGMDNTLEQVTAVAPTGAVPVIPGIGPAGVLLDLDTLARASRPQDGVFGEVWLAAQTPPAVVTALTRAGLQIIDERSHAALLADYQAQGPAVAIRFDLLAAILAMLLGVGAVLLVAAVDRRPLAAEYTALRVQGVASRVVATAALRTYLWITLVGFGGGLLATGVAWALVGPRLPVFATDVVPVSPPAWPTVAAMLPTMGVAGLGLGIAAVVAATAVRRATESSTRRHR